MEAGITDTLHDLDFIVKLIDDRAEPPKKRGPYKKRISNWATTQYTSDAFTQVLKDHDTDISMDGKGAWRDNVFVERLWRSVKYGRGLSECLWFHGRCQAIIETILRIL